MVLTVSETRTIDAPIDVVWEYFVDVRKIQLHNPWVKSVELPTPNKQSKGVGAVRICHFHDGNSLEEVVKQVDDDDDKKAIWLSVPSPQSPIKMLDIEFNLTPVSGADNRSSSSSQRTNVSMKFSYTVKYGMLGKFINYVMIRPKLHEVARTILAGLDYHLKTGKEVGPKTKLDI